MSTEMSTQNDFSVCERERVKEAVCQLLWCPTVIMHEAGFNLLITRQEKTDRREAQKVPDLKKTLLIYQLTRQTWKPNTTTRTQFGFLDDYLKI